MSVRFLSAVLEDPRFESTDKSKLLVAIAIADCARSEDGRAWPSVETIARKARTSVRGVQDACRELEKEGILKVEIGKGPHGTNLYFLCYGVQPLRGATVAGCNGAPDEAADEAPPRCTQSVINHQEPAGTVKKRQRIPKSELDIEGFAEFWIAYPKKKSRGKAEEAWAKHGCSKLTALILAKVAEGRTSFDWTKEGGKWIPYPASWLNAKGWEDDFQPSFLNVSPARAAADAGRHYPEPTKARILEI